GPRPTTHANGGTQLIPNTDAFMLAWQAGARLTFPNSVYRQLAPPPFKHPGNGEPFNVPFVGGNPNLSNTASMATNQTGINSLLVFDLPAEVGWKLWDLPMRIFGEFSDNFEGHAPATARAF